MQSFRPVLSDLADIYEFVASENLAAAERFVDSIAEKISNLAGAGNRGVARDYIAEAPRAFPFKQRRIYFRIIDNEFYVLHHRRDVTIEFFED